MRFATQFIVFILFLMFVAVGCSSNQINPITPSDYQSEQNLPVNKIDESQSGHNILGSWAFDFNVEQMTASLHQNRENKIHYNATWMLPTPVVVINSYDSVTEIIDVDVTIVNPYEIDAYDVRAIIYSDEIGHELINEDNWTGLFDIGGGEQVNPFKTFATDEPNRLFAGLSEYTENMQILLPGGNGFVRFAIDVSFPDNCAEPYLIDNFSQTDLYDTIGSEALLQVDVFDWQNDVSMVSLFCPEITNTVMKDFHPVSGSLWNLDLLNATVAPAGEYEGVILAYSDNSAGVFLYDFVTISIVEDPVTEWTILIYADETSDAVEFFVQGLNEIETVGSVAGDLNIITLYNKVAAVDDVILEMAFDPNGQDEILISPEIDDGGEVILPEGLDMGDGETVENFLRWSMREYPASNYGIILMGHGSGPFGIQPDPYPVFSCTGGLSMWELADACETVCDEYPETDKLAFIGFDSCLMGYIETGYVLRNACDVVVASELPIPMEFDFPFHVFLSHLKDNIKTCDTEELTAVMVNSYIDEMPPLGPWDFTMSACRCSDFESSVIPALNDFCQELINALPEYKSAVTDARDESGRWGFGCFEAFIGDIGCFADKVASSDSLPQEAKDAAYELVLAIENGMVNHGHTGSGTNACPYEESGFQIWFPTNYNNSGWDSCKADYILLGFGDDTLWDDFLAAFSD